MRKKKNKQPPFIEWLHIDNIAVPLSSAINIVPYKCRIIEGKAYLYFKSRGWDDEIQFSK